MREEITTLSSSDPRRDGTCIVCSQSLGVGAQVVFCPRCKSPHHLPCWVEKGGCGKHGCRQVARRDLLPPKTHEPIRPAKIPRWAIWSVVAGLLLIAAALGWSAKTAMETRASTMTVMVPSIDDEELWYRLVETYNQAPPTPKRLELLFTPYGPMGSSFDQKLVVLLAARDGPEVVVLQPDRFQDYAEQEALMPLDDVLSALETRGVRINSERLARGRIDGVLYGLPHPYQESFLVAPVVSRHTGEGKQLLLWIAEKLYGPPIAVGAG